MFITIFSSIGVVRDCLLVGALSPVNHRELHKGCVWSTKCSNCLQKVNSTAVSLVWQNSQLLVTFHHHFHDCHWMSHRLENGWSLLGSRLGNRQLVQVAGPAGDSFRRSHQSWVCHGWWVRSCCLCKVSQRLLVQNVMIIPLQWGAADREKSFSHVWCRQITRRKEPTKS